MLSTVEVTAKLPLIEQRADRLVVNIENNLTDESTLSLDIPESDKKLSKSKAVLLTLLAPGAGHFYIGEKGRGEVFMGAEVVSWLGFFAF